MWTLVRTKRTLQYMAVEVGVRELRENLSEWLDRAASGEDVIVTERGIPKVRLSAATGEHIIEQLVREGRARAAAGPRGPAPRPVPVKGSPVTDALLAQRRAKEY